MSDHYTGAEPGEGGALEEGARHEGTGDTSDASGDAGTPEPTTERDAPRTDPEVKDAGPPSEGVADPEGSSGAEEGINPWAPEAYDVEGQGPTASTEDS